MFMGNVGKYTSPIDPMGYETGQFNEQMLFWMDHEHMKYTISIHIPYHRMHEIGMFNYMFVDLYGKRS